MAQNIFFTIFKNLLDTGVHENTRPEQQRIINGANILYLLIILTGAFFYCEFFTLGNYAFLLAGSLGIIGSLGCMIYARYIKFHVWHTLLILLAFESFFLYRAISSQLLPPYLIWVFVFPFTYQLALGIRLGSVMLLLHSLLAMPSFFWHGTALNESAPAEMRFQLLLIYVVMAALSVGGEFIRMLSNQKVAALMSQLRDKSQTDELTGLHNRRAFQSKLDMELQRSLRTGRAFSLIMCDIDFFKTVNDTYGHLCGDIALKHLAGILNRRCRKTDTVSRWGGEEFMALLPETKLGDATRIAEELRSTVAASPCYCGSAKIFLTISLGVHECNAQGKMDDHLKTVDDLLYKAKETGRNRVCTDLDV